MKKQTGKLSLPETRAPGTLPEPVRKDISLEELSLLCQDDAWMERFTLKQYLPGRPKKAQTAPMKASKRFMTSTERLMRQLQKLHSQVLLTF